MKYANSVLLVLLAGFCGTPSFAQGVDNAPKFANREAEALFHAAPATYKDAEPYAEKWTEISEKDVVWHKRIWRIIDIDEAGNETLKPASRFFIPVINALREGSIEFYSGADDRFAQKLTNDELSAMLNQAVAKQGDTPVYHHRYLLKQDWLFLNDGRGLVCRTIGIAPLVDLPNNSTTAPAQPLFWIYYPTFRPFLAQQRVEGVAGVANLDEWFEGDRYASTITKTSDQVFSQEFNRKK